ncbi:MAG: GcrA family cell cycle regulator [Pseudomonadota bacterium]
MSWTDERVARLTKLWADGLSASQIAAELGGVTRNAVIGKVHRLGLSGRAKSSGSSSTPRPKRQPRVSGYSSRSPRTSQRALNNLSLKISSTSTAARALAEEDLEAPEPLKLALTELTEKTCKWPIGDPATEDFYFCGQNVGECGPYCKYHAKLAYQPVVDRRREKKAASA